MPKLHHTITPLGFLRRVFSLFLNKAVASVNICSSDFSSSLSWRSCNADKLKPTLSYKIEQKCQALKSSYLICVHTKTLNIDFVFSSVLIQQQGNCIDYIFKLRDVTLSQT